MRPSAWRGSGHRTGDAAAGSPGCATGTVKKCLTSTSGTHSNRWRVPAAEVRRPRRRTRLPTWDASGHTGAGSLSVRRPPRVCSPDSVPSAAGRTVAAPAGEGCVPLATGHPPPDTKPALPAAQPCEVKRTERAGKYAPKTTLKAEQARAAEGPPWRSALGQPRPARGLLLRFSLAPLPRPLSVLLRRSSRRIDFWARWWWPLPRLPVVEKTWTTVGRGTATSSPTCSGPLAGRKSGKYDVWAPQSPFSPGCWTATKTELSRSWITGPQVSASVGTERNCSTRPRLRPSRVTLCRASP